MTYGSCPYAWIYYCTHQYLSIKFGIKKNPSRFNFKLNISDSYKNFFAISLKYKNLFTMFCKDFYIAYLLKSFFKGHVLN
jgi:hypothetical protein